MAGASIEAERAAMITGIDYLDADRMRQVRELSHAAWQSAIQAHDATVAAFIAVIHIEKRSDNFSLVSGLVSIRE